MFLAQIETSDENMFYRENEELQNEDFWLEDEMETDGMPEIQMGLSEVVHYRNKVKESISHSHHISEQPDSKNFSLYQANLEKLNHANFKLVSKIN